MKLLQAELNSAGTGHQLLSIDALLGSSLFAKCPYSKLQPEAYKSNVPHLTYTEQHNICIVNQGDRFKHRRMGV